jgi:hypothetical protein
MKELINDLIEKSGLSHEAFAQAVCISPSNLSNKKKCRHIDHEKIISWAKALNIQSVEGWIKGTHITIKCQ